MNRREEALFEAQIKGALPDATEEGHGDEDLPDIKDMMDSFLGNVAYLKAGLERMGFADEEHQAQMISVFFECGG